MRRTLADTRKTELEKLGELKRQLVRQQEIAVEEILQLLSASEFAPKPRSVEGLSFIQTIRAQGLSQWHYNSTANTAFDNLKLLLKRSLDLQITLSRIVQHKNMPCLVKTKGYPFFLKVKEDWIQIIRDYLGDNLIIDDRAKKRNIRPKKK